MIRFSVKYITFLSHLQFRLIVIHFRLIVIHFRLIVIHIRLIVIHFRLIVIHLRLIVMYQYRKVFQSEFLSCIHMTSSDITYSP